MLHVNEAQCLNGHNHRQPTVSIANLRLSHNWCHRQHHYCTTPLSLQLTFSAHSPVQHECCLVLTLTTHRYPLPSTCYGECSMSQAGAGSTNTNTTQPPTIVTATTTRDSHDFANLARLHGSVNWHLHCTREVYQSFYVGYPRTGLCTRGFLKTPTLTVETPTPGAGMGLLG